MSDTVVVVLGALASICSVVSFAPQAMRVWKARSAEGVSAPMFAITTVGFALWTAYGVALGEWPIIGTNTLCFCLAGFILVMVVMPSRWKRRIKGDVDHRARRTAGRAPGAQLHDGHRHRGGAPHDGGR